MKPRSEADTLTQHTTVYLAYDDVNLYIAAQCYESRMDKVKADITERDGKLWEDDCIEVFVNPGEEDERNYYHFIANPLGVRYDAKVYKDTSGKIESSQMWQGDWKAAASMNKDSWSVELVIPFYAFAIGDKDWRICVCREERPSREYSCFAGNFHAPEKFGVLKNLTVDFEKEFPCRVDSVSFGSRMWGTNTFHAVVTVRDRKQCTVDAVLTVFDAQEDIETEVVRCFNLSYPMRTDILFYYRLTGIEGIRNARFSLKDRKTSRIIFQTSSCFQIPPVLEAQLDRRIYYVSQKHARGSIFVRTGVPDYGNLTLDISVKRIPGNKTVLHQRINTVFSNNTVVLDIEKLPVGRYTAEFELFGKKRNRIAGRSYQFERIPGPFDN